MQNEGNFDIKNVQTNDTLSALFVDGAVIHSRKDGMYYIRLTAARPDVVREQACFVINNEHLREMITVFCKIAGYYPEKPKQ